MLYYQPCSNDIAYGVLMTQTSALHRPKPKGGETMNKSLALTTAIDLAKTIVSSNGIQHIPNKASTEDLANFIETLADRLEKMNPET